MDVEARSGHFIELLAGRWTLAVLAQLADGGRGYQDLDDALVGVSHKVLRRSKEPSIVVR
jgi:DNA-binding HxlR family transcriptional regulator